MMDKTVIRLSDSAIKDWETCQKKYWFKHIERLQAKSRIAVFDVGTLGHYGCAIFLHPTNAQFDVATRYKMAREGIKKHFEEKMKPHGATKNVLDEAIHTFPVIMRRKLDVQVISVEQWWETEIVVDPPGTDDDGIYYTDGLYVQFVGKVDAISMHENHLLVEEHKFTSGIGFGDKRIQQYQRARQPKGYAFLGNENLKQNKIVGVLHNFFLKMKNPKLEQRITYIGPKDLRRFKDSVCKVAREVHTAQQSGVWRESLDSCYGEWWPCPFNVLCEFDDNEEVRKQNFTKRESQAKFDTLIGTKQSGVKENISEETGGLRGGVET